MASLGSLLNDNHRRVLASSLTHFDNLLVDVETIASGAAARSPLSPYVPDLNPSELHILQDYVTEIRSRMAEMASALDLGTARSNTPTSRAVDVTLLSAEIGLAELRPENLRGYGQLSDAGATAVEQFTAELSRLIQRLRGLIARASAADLTERVARIRHAPVDLAALGALERVIRQHGLVLFRESLEALLERLERRTFEICVFGRVNAGKSSLLNAVLDTNALPVGVTPVTAVPTRIVFGATAEATIRFGNGERMAIPLPRLREFVSEEENPENRKRVTAVQLRLPSRHLADGLAFVDTPGLGSLATAGARESYRYLPRCDLGILLIDTSTPPTRDDLDVLRLLHASDIPAMGVLTKADLLSDADLDRVQTHAEAQIAHALGREVALQAVSTRGAAAARAQAWFATTIAPLCARGRTLADESARARFARLTSAAVTAARAETTGGAAAAERYDQLESVAAAADRCLRDSRRRCDEISSRLRTSLPEALDAAATVAARRVVADGDGAVMGEVVVVALEMVASRQFDSVLQELLGARHHLQELLARACALAGGLGTPESLHVDLVGQPKVTMPLDIRELAFTPPRWLRLSQRLLHRRILLTMHERLDRSGGDVLAQLAGALQTWAGRVLDNLGRQFAVQTDPIRTTERGRVLPGATATRAITRADRRDLEMLERLIPALQEGREQPDRDHPSLGPSSQEAERCSQGR